MKYLTVIAVPFLAGQALASLNCTVVSPTLTKRYCEWDGCQAYETAVASDIVHAGCRADCDTNEDPWLKLYDGSYIRAADKDTIKDCRYHCVPFPITGLPHCYEEAGKRAPTNCADSSASGLASKIPAPQTLGTEPPPFSDIVTKCSLGTAKRTAAPLVA
ncbi:uncharacterized protein E0L32_003770 [Thyridium curvatum]|uniref:Uncharacterized protein n=1 Tax=Thyridium curvatum TaxID=1093900 RepID=A0A507BB68_9PEZI|nr:uncharacterized protein E0L32_003770 [Thyridium curvatum]TPX16476.1 hypothetical protein E0L32_003770 [Thyridium curvatum]